MYIKRIIIQGFKTYKNRTVIDAVSPDFNVVVGRNGSGKSNFFAAIRFVLSDAYTHMSREERQGLIHEGSGTVMSAYVEIIFDNTDRRLPISKDEVSVRRTIGLKKDDYSLDNKTATRSDIMNLLESAGFSRSNPYYIVPQGRITALTNSKDSERLNLLKDVSGAKVFEAKLKESLREMENSNLKRERIDEALASISERLGDLQIESNDLRNYQQLEKDRKIYEFNLFDRELNELNEEIDDIELKYRDQLEKSSGDLKVLEENEKHLNLLTEELNQLKNDMKLVSLEKDQNKILQTQTMKEISVKLVKLEELEQELQNYKAKQDSVVDEIRNYRSLVDKTKENIFFLKPKLRQLQEQESTIKNRLIELRTRQRAIFSKQSRFQRFGSIDERDEWLNGEISKLLRDLKQKESEIDQFEQQIAQRKQELSELETKEDELNNYVNDASFQNDIRQLHKSINDLKLKLNETSDKRKALWRDEVKYKSVNDSLTNDLTTATQLVNQTMDRLQSQGLKAVQQITASLGLQNNVLGPLVDLFNVSDKYKTAVEVIAGNALFHVVVDTDETASILMEELVRAKAGRVTFMPLNRLNSSQQIQYPDSTENQCIPLIKKIKFSDNRITPAIQHVFSRTIVCNDLMKGSDLARSYNLTAITLDGDRVDTRGALSGGYRDYKSSRIDAIKIQSKKKKEIQQNAEKLVVVERDINNINEEFNHLSNELNQQTKALEEKYLSINPIKSEINHIQNKRVQVEQEVNSLESNLNSVISLKQNLTTNLEQHQEELASDFTQSLSEEEVASLEALKKEINEHEHELTKAVDKSADMETQLAKYEAELSLNLRPHLQSLANDTTANPLDRMIDYEVEELKQDIKRLEEQLAGIGEAREAVMARFHQATTEIEAKEAEISKLNDKQIVLVNKLDRVTKATEKNMNKKSVLMSRRDEINKKIRDIGVLPEDAFDTEKYEGYEADELLRKLKEINEELKQYSHINKKAIEQYTIFNTRQTELIERRQELDQSRESIETLIEKLRQQKDQAIAKSFHLVARNFTAIFEKLAPDGTGKLLMQKRQQSDEEDETIEEASDNIDDYVGVAISVSFNSKNDEQQRIEQLSGGQKSLCAITLILAIQSCDPAPFYLFDEIDANLDDQYRTAVASMINALSDKAQFICTTFRPEMLQVAKKFYGVSFNNKVSTVSEITRSEATSFVEGQPK